MSGNKTKVGVVQLNSNADVNRNLESLHRTVRAAANDGAELIVVPECFAFLGPENGKLDIAESLDERGPILRDCLDLAREASADLILGGFWEKSSIPSKVRNTCVHAKRDGTLGAVYRKIHLFDVDLPDGTSLKESSSVEAGKDVITADTTFGKLGLTICYDVRFPELYRQLVDRGAVAMAIPAAFTLTTGKEHWHVLLRARAIESQSYVLAAAQTGHHFGNRHSYGHALIVDPWGCVIAECSEGEGFATAWLDPEVVHRVRTQLPSLRHRRL